MKNKDEQILLKNVYIFYDKDRHGLVASQAVNYPGIPFTCTPNPRTISDRYAYQMYKTNNLYYIISNGGMELTFEQEELLLEIRDKVVGNSKSSRIKNEDTATLTREEIHSLVAQLSSHISKHHLIRLLKTNQITWEKTIL